MNRRLLIVEPDPSGRVLMDRVLTAEGFTAEEYESALHAKLLLDDGAFDVAVVDEFGGNGAVLAEVRYLRERYPNLPLVVTGTMLTQPILLDLMRLGVTDALPKPFTPAELRDAVNRMFARRTPGREGALEYDAAHAMALAEFLAGRPEASSRALARLHAVAPLDAEGMALEALRAELAGRDDEASRAYRAALALRHDEATPPPDPYESLARLGAYGAARPVDTFGSALTHAPLILAASVTALPDGLAPPYVLVTALGLATRESPVVYRRARDDCGFALLTTDLRAERIAPALATLGDGPVIAGPGVAVDLGRLESLRHGAAVESATRVSGSTRTAAGTMKGAP